MTVQNLRAIAIRKHREALAGARFWNVPVVIIPRTPYSRYLIQGGCRAEAVKHLERAAAARFVYMNAQRMASL